MTLILLNTGKSKKEPEKSQSAREGAIFHTPGRPLERRVSCPSAEESPSITLCNHSLKNSLRLLQSPHSHVQSQLQQIETQLQLKLQPNSLAAMVLEELEELESILGILNLALPNVDSCCIEKWDLEEFSKSINNMAIRVKSVDHSIRFAKQNNDDLLADDDNISSPHHDSGSYSSRSSNAENPVQLANSGVYLIGWKESMRDFVCFIEDSIALVHSISNPSTLKSFKISAWKATRDKLEDQVKTLKLKIKQQKSLQEHKVQLKRQKERERFFQDKVVIRFQEEKNEFLSLIDSELMLTPRTPHMALSQTEDQNLASIEASTVQLRRTAVDLQKVRPFRPRQEQAVLLANALQDMSWAQNRILICHMCGERILKGSPVITTTNFSYHKDHFKCFRCKMLLLEEERFFIEENEVCCETCVEESAAICSHCQRCIAKDEEYCSAMGKLWHTSCFRCSGMPPLCSD